MCGSSARERKGEPALRVVGTMDNVVPRELNDPITLQLDIRDATTIALPSKMTRVSFETVTLNDEVSPGEEKVDPITVAIRHGQRHLSLRYWERALAQQTRQLHFQR
jgi:hypothetical protein